MNKLIEKMWYEEFRPAEKHFIYNEEISRKQLFLDKYEEQLRKLLDDKEKKIFEEFVSAFFDILDLEKLDAFTAGIHFAGKIVKGLFIE